MRGEKKAIAKLVAPMGLRPHIHLHVLVFLVAEVEGHLNPNCAGPVMVPSQHDYIYHVRVLASEFDRIYHYLATL